MQLISLSRILFTRAKTLWNWAIMLNGCAFLVATISIFTKLDDDRVWSLVVAGTVAVIGIAAYMLHILFEQRYRLAERARRQGVLSYGLGWPVPAIIRDDLFVAAGAKAGAAASMLKTDGYYDTKEAPGAPRLAEMLEESTFWTYYQYVRIRKWLAWMLVALVTVLVAVAVSFLVSPLPNDLRVAAGKFILAFVPSAVVLGVIRWILDLNELITELGQHRQELDALRTAGTIKERDILRLVSEYNSQMIWGFPIPDVLYRRWRDELNDLWAERKRSLSTPQTPPEP